MLVGKILQQRYHIVAQISSNNLLKTYMALEQSSTPQPIKYIIKHFLPPAKDIHEALVFDANEILALRLRLSTQLQQLNGLSDQLPKLFQCWLRQDHLFLAYEYIDGHNLAEELGLGQVWPENTTIGIVAEIMAVLQPLHQQNIGHGNLHLRQLVRRDADKKVFITDVGLMALAEPKSLQEPLTRQQDLQALGQIAIEALTGVALSELTDNTTGQVNWQQRADCSPAFTAIIDRLISTDAGESWPSVLPAWIELSKIMHQTLRQPIPPIQPSLTTIEPESDLEVEIDELKQQADRKFVQGDALGAVADYGKIIELDPYPIYYNNRGIIYTHALGEYEKALQDFNTAIALKPDFASAFHNRAHVQRMRGNLSEAITDYDWSLSLLPNMAIIYWERAITYHQMENFVAALEDYTKFLELQPYHAEAYHQRGNIHQKLGDSSAALTDYDQSLNINPLVALTYYDRAGLYAQQANLPAALADYDRALQTDPNLVMAYNNRGIVKRRQGDLVGAIADYSQGLNIEPDSIDLLRNRGIARQQLQDFTGALADFQRAATLYLNQGRQAEYEKILNAVSLLQQQDTLPHPE